MKFYWYVALAIAVLLLGPLLYYLIASPSDSMNPEGLPETGAVSGQGASGPITPVMVDGAVPASSYGQGSVGKASMPSVTLESPILSTELGTITGTAKPKPGMKTPNYISMKVALYDPKTERLLASTALDASGFYKFIVQPGEYVLSFMPGMGSSAQLPQRFLVRKGDVVNINFFVN